jgi:serine protease Do
MTEQPLQVSKSLAILTMVAMLFLGGVVGSLATEKARSGAAAGTPPSAGVAEPPADVSSLSQGFRAVVQKTLPAVVNISTTKVVETRRERSPFFMDPFFRDFFGFDWGFDIPRERRERSLGSGVIVSPDGIILTNEHVIRDAAEIVVALADKRELKADIVGADPKTDIAVLKLKERAENLPHLKLGDSKTVAVGDIVLAMGNPFGIGQTVTMGIVSATGRGGLNIEDYEDFIQTDAAINPGNSGGPLVNVRGEVIGINTAILSRSGGHQGIGFAVPSNMAREVMQQIIEKGRVVRGWLGVSIQPVTPAMAKALKLAEPSGAIVGNVESGSPAARAGLQTGDVIVGVDEEKIEDSRQLQLTIARAGPGKRVNLRVVREGKPVTIPVTLGELPERAEEAGRRPGQSGPLEGVQVDDLTPQLARQLGLPRDTFGVVVTQVQPFSRAAEAGLQRGDVIQEVNREAVTNVATFERAIRRAGDGPIMLLVNRGGRTFFVVIEGR